MRRLVLLTSGAALGVALAVTASLAPDTAVAQSAGEKEIAARQGFMKLVSWSAGPLFGMAKGDVAYDAAVAETRAANLKALTQFTFPALFVEGTSKEDQPGKTRALPAIWSDNAGFTTAFANLGTAVDNLVARAGVGQAELAAAVGELGKACGGCHNTYRAKDF